jgi:YD repeat-containing protein
VTQFTYDTDGNPTILIDGNGNTKSITYDEFHQMTKTLSAEGISHSFEYDKNGKETKQILTQSDGTPLETTKSYDILDHLAEVNQQITALKATKIQYTYDGNENVKKITYPNGTTKEFIYNEQDKVIKIVVSGQETKYQYDNNGNIIKITDPKGNTQDIQYNLFDEPVKVTDSKGTYTLFTYDTVGNITSSQVFDTNNVLLSKQSREYDIFSHLVKQIGYSVTGNDTITTKYAYEKGLLTEKIDPKGNSTKLSYDIYGRATETTDSIGNKQVFMYDNNGNIIFKKLIQSNGKTTETKYTYDRDNRLVLSSIVGESIQAIETKYTYNTLNQIIETIDGNGNHTKYTYDGLGNVLVKTEAVNGKEVKISYEYDSMGNVTSLTDANGNKTTYEYDNLNRRTKELLVDGSFTTYSYDANGNLASYTDPNGTIVTNTYDTLNRLTKRSITRGTNVLGVTEETYSYDALGRLIGGNDDQNNVLAFEYDGLNNLTKETNNGKNVNYVYDANSNLTSLTTPSEKKVDRNYDVLNRLTGITLDGKNIASYGYNSVTLDTLTLGNGTKTSYGYDSLLRLKELTNIASPDKKNPTGEMIQKLSFSYDATSNILGNGHDNYSYDSLNRLTQAGYEATQDKKSISESFAYDPMGNRLSSSSTEMKTVGKDKPKTTSTSYDINTLNQYFGSNGAKLSYDKNGNLVNNGVFQFSYDYRNRLVEVKKV